jgi:hypothetical protein
MVPRYICGLSSRQDDQAFAQGSYNKDGLAVKNTCKALGVNYTYKAINEYLKG